MKVGLKGLEQRKRSWRVRGCCVMVLCLLARATAAFGQLNFNIPLYSLTNHNTSAYSNYTENTYGGNFGDSTWLDTNGDTMAIDPALVDESLNPVTPGHVSHVDCAYADTGPAGPAVVRQWHVLVRREFTHQHWGEQ
jgi:hypothetical protein